ncbi:TPA: hypothetical protein ACPJ0A_004551, partial [Vibrio diabolicus]
MANNSLSKFDCSIPVNSIPKAEILLGIRPTSATKTPISPATIRWFRTFRVVSVKGSLSLFDKFANFIPY